MPRAASSWRCCCCKAAARKKGARSSIAAEASCAAPFQSSAKPVRVLSEEAYCSEQSNAVFGVAALSDGSGHAILNSANQRQDGAMAQVMTKPATATLQAIP